MSIVTLTQDNFDETIEKNALVVIDFGAKWCGPCRGFSQVIHELDKKYPEVTFGTVDIEQEKELAEEFNIVSIPAIMMVRDRVMIFAQTGALTFTAMEELIEKAKNLDAATLRKMQEGGAIN